MRVRTRLVAAVVALAGLTVVGTVGGASVRQGAERSVESCPTGYELLAQKLALFDGVFGSSSAAGGSARSRRCTRRCSPRAPASTRPSIPRS